MATEKVTYVLDVKDDGTVSLKRFNKALGETRKSGKLADKTIDKLNKTLKTGLATGVKAAGVAITGLIAASTAFGVRFEKSISRLSALTGATGTELAKLEQTALRLGQTTVFSANEAAGAMIELGKVGFDTTQTLEGTAAVLDLAAASGEDLAVSAEAMAATLKGFGLDAEESQRVVDVMADSFRSSALNLDRFSESIKFIAPLAANAGIEIEETTAAVASLSDAGINGTLAGTALRTIILELSDSTSKASKEIQRLGLENATLAEKLQVLTDNGTNSTKALDFFNKRAVTGALVIGKSTQKIAELTEQFEKAGGAAQEMADVALDNLAGSFTLLLSASESAGIELFEIFGPTLRGFVDGVTEGVVAFTDAIKNLNAGPFERLENRLQKINELLEEQDQILIKGLDVFTQREKLTDQQEKLQRRITRQLELTNNQGLEQVTIQTELGKLASDLGVNLQDTQKTEENLLKLRQEFRRLSDLTAQSAQTEFKIRQGASQEARADADAFAESNKLFLDRLKTVTELLQLASQQKKVQEEIKKINEDIADIGKDTADTKKDEIDTVTPEGDDPDKKAADNAAKIAAERRKILFDIRLRELEDIEDLEERKVAIIEATLEFELGEARRAANNRAELAALAERKAFDARQAVSKELQDADTEQQEKILEIRQERIRLEKELEERSLQDQLDLQLKALTDQEEIQRKRQEIIREQARARLEEIELAFQQEKERGKLQGDELVEAERLKNEQLLDARIEFQNMAEELDIEFKQRELDRTARQVEEVIDITTNAAGQAIGIAIENEKVRSDTNKKIAKTEEQFAKDQAARNAAFNEEIKKIELSNAQDKAAQISAVRKRFNAEESAELARHNEQLGEIRDSGAEEQAENQRKFFLGLLKNTISFIRKEFFAATASAAIRALLTGGTSIPGDASLALGANIALGIAEAAISQGLQGGGRIGGSDEDLDDVPARLNRDEFVINQSAARSVGFDNLEFINETGELPFQDGGAVAVQGEVSDRGQPLNITIQAMDSADVIAFFRRSGIPVLEELVRNREFLNDEPLKDALVPSKLRKQVDDNKFVSALGIG